MLGNGIRGVGDQQHDNTGLLGQAAVGASSMCRLVRGEPGPLAIGTDSLIDEAAHTKSVAQIGRCVQRVDDFALDEGEKTAPTEHQALAELVDVLQHRLVPALVGRPKMTHRQTEKPIEC